MKNEIWIEKYRPKSFEEVVGQDIIGIKKMISDKPDIPHLLFISKSPGTGKTSIATLIIKEHKSNFIMLNASDERGIDVIRNKVLQFVVTSSTDGKIKYVLLDESDNLSKEAQKALLNPMEKYAHNCRFIFTGNYINKFDDALISRCILINLQIPPKSEIKSYLQKIITAELLNISDKNLDTLIDICYPDIRKMVNRLQNFNLTKDINRVILKTLDSVSSEMYDTIKKLDFYKCREIMLSNNIDIDLLFLEIHDVILKDEKISDNTKLSLIIEIAECLKVLSLIISKEILFEAFVAKSINILRSQR